MAPRLPPLPALRDFVHLYRLKAKKILSQNYLMDMNLTRKIVRQADLSPSSWVCEVGPGPGGITRAILEHSPQRVDVIEIDQRFIPALKHLSESVGDRLYIHNGDVLKTCVGSIWQNAKGKNWRESVFEWMDDPPDMHIIGNLPFNIASPLIIKYLREISYRKGPWSFGRVPLTLTFQMEVARRICAPIDSDSRARISVMSQLYTDPKLMFSIAGSCFVPPPKVDVGVIRFIPKVVPLATSPFGVVEKLVRQVFHYRQKYAVKGLKTLYPPDLADELAHEVLRECRVSPSTTSIRIGLDEYAHMAAIYEQQCRRIPGLILYDYTRPKVELAELSGRSGAVPESSVPSCDVPREGVPLHQFDSVLASSL